MMLAVSDDPEVRKQCVDNILDILRLITEDESDAFAGPANDGPIADIDVMEPFGELGEEFMEAHKILEFRELEEKKKNAAGPTAIARRTETLFIDDTSEENADEWSGDMKIDFYKYYRDMPKEKFFTPEFLQFSAEINEACELENLLEEKARNEELLNRRKPKREKSPQNEDYIETESLSNLWCMLEASTENKRDFNVSQIGYNIFEDERFSWLKHDDIDLETIELTKAKCEKWLKDGTKEAGKSGKKDARRDPKREAREK